MDACQVLIDHLDRRADARPVAQAVGAGGIGGERRLGCGESRGIARGHDRELAGLGADLATRDRRVQEPAAGFGEPGADGLGGSRRHGAVEDDRGACGQAGRGTGLAEQHIIGLRGGCYDEDQECHVARGLGRARHGFAAAFGERRSRLLSDIEAAHRMAAPDQVERHGEAHGSHSDEPDRPLVAHICSTLPSTEIAWPEMLAAAGLQRKATMAATSSAVTLRRKETRSR